MAFQIKSFKDLVAMTKEKLDESMVPLRVRAARAKAEGEKVALETKMLDLETQINELCAKKELDFSAIADKLDDYDLAERRLGQITRLVEQLFPEGA